MAKKHHGDPLTRQARQIAQASAPSKKLINRQYARSQNDVAGFGAGLLAALHAAGGQSASAYQDAVTQQQGVDQGAQDRLAGLGGAYPGAAVSVGAAGDSALSRLTADQAAMGGYQAQLPEVAASRTRVAQEGLTNARKDAMLQRADAISQQVPQIRSQLASQQFDQKLALANLSLSQQRLAETQSYHQSELGLRAQSNKLSGARLTQDEAHWRSGFIAKYGWDPYSGKKVRVPGGAGSSNGKINGFTKSEFYGYRKTANTILSPSQSEQHVSIYGWVDSKGNPLLRKGQPVQSWVGVKPDTKNLTPPPNAPNAHIGIVGNRTYVAGRPGWVKTKSFAQAVEDLITQGVPRSIALWSAVRAYRSQPRNSAAYQSYLAFVSGGVGADTVRQPHPAG